MAEDKAARRTGGKPKSQGRAGSTAKSAPGAGAARTGGRPKAVKPPTINLKAEDVSAKEAATAPPAGKPSPRAAASGTAATETAKPETAKPETAKPETAKRENAGSESPQAARPKDQAASTGANQPSGGNRPGLIGYASAAAVGAAAAAVVSLGVTMIGIRTPDTGALETRIAEIAEQNADTVALQQQIDVLVARQTQLGEQIGTPNDATDAAGLSELRTALESSLAATQGELSALAETVSGLSASGAGAGSDAIDAQISALTERLGSAEQRLDQIATSEDLLALQEVIASAAGEDGEGAAGLSGLAQLGQAISDETANLSARIDTMEPTIQGLTDALTALEERMAESLGTGASMSDIEGLGDRIASIDGQLGDMRDSVAGAIAANAATGQLLAEHEERVATLEAAIADIRTALGTVQDRAASGTADRAAMALALAQFRDAVQGGGPFAAPLETLSAILGSDRPELAVLASHAEAGVPTATELAARFEAVAGDIVAAASIREDAGILGRLVDNARGIVSVRPVSPVSGDTPAAIVSRISGSLADGRLNAAGEEWAALPEPAREAAADWGRQLVARVEVDGAVDRLAAGLLADLRNAAGAASVTQ